MGPANVKVIHAHEFVRARPGGVLDLETSEALLLKIAKAVLCPIERFDRARFFALLADSKGFEVEAFTSYEEAVTWLSGENC